MKIVLDADSLFYYLNEHPPARGDTEEETWKPEGTSFSFPISISMGRAKLPAPLHFISFGFYGTKDRYCGMATIHARKMMDLKNLSRNLSKAFTPDSGYLWNPIHNLGIEGYICEKDQKAPSAPSFAVDYGKNSKNKFPVFFISTGGNGSKLRTLDPEPCFFEEIGAFGGVASRFLDACFSLNQTGRSLRNVPVIPSTLELSCLNVGYG